MTPHANITNSNNSQKSRAREKKLLLARSRDAQREKEAIFARPRACSRDRVVRLLYYH